MFALMAGISVFAGLVGLAAAGLAYRRPMEDWAEFEQGLQPVWGWWEQAYRVDDFYNVTVVQPGKKAAEAAAFSVDLPVIDGAVTGRQAGPWHRRAGPRPADRSGAQLRRTPLRRRHRPRRLAGGDGA